MNTLGVVKIQSIVDILANFIIILLLLLFWLYQIDFYLLQNFLFKIIYKIKYIYSFINIKLDYLTIIQLLGWLET